MIIETPDGRHRSKLTTVEKERELEARWKSLSEDEKKGFRAIVDELDDLMVDGGNYDNLEELVQYSGAFHDLVNAHYTDRLVSIDEFCLDDYYLGEIGKSFYEVWRDDMNEMFSGRYTEAIITGSIGSGKCLSGDTEFYDPLLGRRRTLREASHSDIVSVPSFDKSTNTTRGMQASVRLSGQKKLGTLKLKSGKELRMSVDHPVLTSSGWKPIGELAKGDMIAVSKSIPEPENSLDIRDDEVEFIAFLLAGGPFRFDDNDESKRFIKVTKSLLDSAEGTKRRLILDDNGVVLECDIGDVLRGRRYKVFMKSSRRRVPAEYYGLSDEQLGLFLNRIWFCRKAIEDLSDGHLAMEVESEFLARDIQTLLLRFAIRSTVSQVKICRGDESTGYWEWGRKIEIEGEEDIGSFIRNIGLGLERGESGSFCLDSKRYAKMSGRSQSLLDGDPGMFDSVWESWWDSVDWEKIESFVEDDYLSPVYDVEVPGTKNFAPSGIIVHNTTFCDMCLAYMFYELCMLNDPQATFGLMPGSEIVLVCFNRDKKLARDVTFGGLKRKLIKSPFFNDLGVKFGTSEMVYVEKNIRIIAISVRSADAMGRDVFGGIIDETDFMEGSVLRGSVNKGGEKGFSELLHESITRRMKSRYDRAGILPGKLLLSSSARHKTSFTNKRISAARNEAHVFCRDYAIYDVAPKARFSSKRFWVLVGTERIKHRILSQKDYKEMGLVDRRELIDHGCKFIRVPDNFRTDFESNIEDSIRDIAGVVTVAMSPFIHMQEKIFEAIDPTLFHPLSSDTWATDETPHIDWSKLVKPYERRTGPGRKAMEIRPRRHPFKQRHVHFDLSLGVQDSAAICIAHIVDTIKVERRTEEGDPTLDEAPLIEVDLILRVDPPSNGEINFASVRGLVYDFMKHGYIISFASADSFQSHDTTQQMEAQGVDSEIVSVDKTIEPYTILKTALYEGRISMYNYPIVLDELVNLQRNAVVQKVDHPQGGCFIGGTLVVLYDGSVSRIADLDGQIVDVLSRAKNGKMVKGRARGRLTKQVNRLLEIWLSNGYIVKCTPEHRWMKMDGEYIEACQMKVGRTVLMPADMSNHVFLKSIREIEFQQSVSVYDLEVEEHHNFSLDAGVVVHNSKDCADALAGVVYTLSKKSSYLAPIAVGISEYADPDAGSEWIRRTMSHSGDKPPEKVGDVPTSGKPIIFLG